MSLDEERDEEYERMEQENRVLREAVMAGADPTKVRCAQTQDIFAL